MAKPFYKGTVIRFGVTGGKSAELFRGFYPFDLVYDAYTYIYVHIEKEHQE